MLGLLRLGATRLDADPVSAGGGQPRRAGLPPSADESPCRDQSRYQFGLPYQRQYVLAFPHDKHDAVMLSSKLVSCRLWSCFTTASRSASVIVLPVGGGQPP